MNKTNRNRCCYFEERYTANLNIR